MYISCIFLVEVHESLEYIKCLQQLYGVEIYFIPIPLSGTV